MVLDIYVARNKSTEQKKKKRGWNDVLISSIMMSENMLSTLTLLKYDQDLLQFFSVFFSVSTKRPVLKSGHLCFYNYLSVFWIYALRWKSCWFFLIIKDTFIRLGPVSSKINCALTLTDLDTLWSSYRQNVLFSTKLESTLLSWPEWNRGDKILTGRSCSQSGAGAQNFLSGAEPERSGSKMSGAGAELERGRAGAAHLWSSTSHLKESQVIVPIKENIPDYSFEII